MNRRFYFMREKLFNNIEIHVCFDALCYTKTRGIPNLKAKLIKLAKSQNMDKQKWKKNFSNKNMAIRIYIRKIKLIVIL